MRNSKLVKIESKYIIYNYVHSNDIEIIQLHGIYCVTSTFNDKVGSYQNNLSRGGRGD